MKPTTRPKTQLANPQRQTSLGMVMRYVLAVVTVAVAMGLRLALEAWVGSGLPSYVTFYPAMMAVVVLTGFGPGVLATVLMTLIAVYWILPPIGEFTIASPVDRLGLAIFTGTNLFMCVIAERFRRNREKAAAYEREAALHDSRARLATFAEATFEGIVESEAGRIVDCNEQFARMSGYAATELKGTQIADLIAPEDLDRVMANIRQDQESVIEHAMLRKDGTRIVIEAHGRDLSPGSAVRHTALRDITDRKQAEEALRQSEEQFSTLVDSIPNLAWWANGDGYITWYNRRWYEYTGTTPEQMEGWGWQSVHDPEMLPKVMERWQASIATGQPFDMEFPLRGADGTFRSFLTRVLPLKDSADKVLRWFGTNTDISALKKVEDSLRESEDRLRIALEAADLGTWDIDPGTGIAVRSLRHDQMFGYQELQSEWTIEIAERHILPEDLPMVQKAHARAIATGEMSLEARVRWPDDSIHWIASLGHAYYDAAGRPVRLIGVVADITERKKAEANFLKLSEDLAARNLELEEVNKELEAFCYSVSHDLRAPLRAIDGFSKILLDKYHHLLDEKGGDYLQRVRTATQKMGQLIDDLLKLSRLTKGGMNITAVDLSRMAGNVATELKRSQAARQVSFAITAGLVTRCDQHLIKVVLDNLLGNAWKFTGNKEQAVIEFGSILIAGTPAYFVRDNGAGFNMAYVDKLFGTFQRLHLERDFPGTGIGLSLVHRIIQRHGGKIWAEGEVGKGATFYFTLTPMKGADHD